MHVPTWLFIVIVVYLVLGTGYGVLATLAALRKLPIPVPDLGSYIFPCGSNRIQTGLTALLEASGKHLFTTANTDSVERNIFTDGTILNVTEPEAYERIGEPAWAIALAPTKEPIAAAKITREILDAYAVKNYYIGAFDPAIPEHTMCGVLVENGLLGNILIVHRVHGKDMPRGLDS